MREQFKLYVINLYKDVPTDVYEDLLSIFCIGAILLIAFRGIRKGWKYVVGLFLVEYVFLIFCATVIFRQHVETVGHNFNLFWSYEAIENGRKDLIAENIMNVVVFVPVGALLGIVSTQRKKGDGGWKIGWALALALGVGFCISVSIEALQYFLKRGFSEFDDVFHNTVGCLIGFMIAAMIKGLWLLQKKYLMN